MKTWESLSAALFLAGVFALGRRIGPFFSRHRRKWMSLFAGVATSYVFIHLLPGLERAQAILTDSTGLPNIVSLERYVYSSALVGFVLLYGLENLRRRSKERHGEAPDERVRRRAYAVHLGGLSVYCATIGCLIPLIEHRNLLSLLLYWLPMALHFLAMDQVLTLEVGAAYERSGRRVLAAAILAGWGATVLFSVPVKAVAAFAGFVGGGVVMNSLISELPHGDEGRFWPFILGAGVYGAILLLV